MQFKIKMLTVQFENKTQTYSPLGGIPILKTGAHIYLVEDYGTRVQAH